VMFCL